MALLFARRPRPRSRGVFHVVVFALALLPVAGADAAEAAKLVRSTACVIGEAKEGRFIASAFAVADGSRLLTTAHGLSDARNLRIKLSDGRMFPVAVERIVPEPADLALLRTFGTRLEAVELGSIESLAVGDRLVTIGCPLGFEFSAASGIVSAIREGPSGFPVIQTDVPVNPGSSGGPLFDVKGRVVGIIKGRVEERDRIHFALPVDLGVALLAETEREERTWALFNSAVFEPRFPEKVRLYRKVIEVAPSLTDARFNLGLVLEQLGRLDESAKEYRETLALEPRHESAGVNLGGILYRQERFDEAIAVLGASLEKHPGSLRLRNNLAEAYRAAGRAKEAEGQFSRLLEVEPDYAPAHFGMGLVCEAGGDAKRALVHYRRYLQLEPDAGDAAKVKEWIRRLEGTG